MGHAIMKGNKTAQQIGENGKSLKQTSQKSFAPKNSKTF